MSKALGCKRVHDDRIAGVTFEENASRNALIVNEEYAWVGNPFSAPTKRGELSSSPLFFVSGGLWLDLSAAAGQWPQAVSVTAPASGP